MEKNKIRVIVNGYKGRMGSETVKAVQKDSGLELVGQTDTGDDLAKAIADLKADVVVDFTLPQCVKQNTITILKSGAYAVIGTTGLSELDLNELNLLAMEKETAVLVAPNFAIGAVMMMKACKEIAKHMTSVEIIEMHHDKKVDAPSGTAIKTAEVIAAANPCVNSLKREEKEVIKGVRGGLKNQIMIHSVRLPGFLASQEVIFGGLGQTLTIRHDTFNRESFMPGVIQALKCIHAYKGLIYGLENIL
ncbi:4-hydroxy-tetrahydrodipicolinate reductase [Thermoproteota archaeon]